MPLGVTTVSPDGTGSRNLRGRDPDCVNAEGPASAWALQVPGSAPLERTETARDLIWPALNLTALATPCKKVSVSAGVIKTELTLPPPCKLSYPSSYTLKPSEPLASAMAKPEPPD
mmetsp:Transcript_43711/g.86229  ORF Transcript_43711/g.86229 Transcript_43711/m.86229 type:complete len:116 (-) Transcript_43711:1232-1579(-)